MSLIEIIPAILPKDFGEIVEKVSYVKGLAKTVQIDICDGHFVPTFTWPYKKSDISFEEIIHEKEGLPDWQNIDYEFDLMVDDAENKVEDFILAGGKRIILHLESKSDLPKAFQIMKGRVEIGLAININTDVNNIEAFGKEIDFIQCMGIDNIGLQGQEFDNMVIEKIKNIRNKYPSLPVSIDGGVSLINAKSLIDAGANRLVVGSAIFSSENIPEVIRKLQTIQ